MDETTKKDSKKREPKVEVFGEDVSSSDRKEEFRERFRYHHHHHGSLPWGLAFILIGLMLLSTNFGILSPIVWSQVARLWPILIVLIGFNVLIGHSEVGDFINSLIALFIFATILGVIFLHTAPNIIHSLPINIQHYLVWLNSYLQIR